MFIFIDVYMFICKCDGGTCLEMAVNGVVFGTMHMRRCGEIKCWGVVVMMLVMRVWSRVSFPNSCGRVVFRCDLRLMSIDSRFGQYLMRPCRLQSDISM